MGGKAATTSPEICEMILKDYEELKMTRYALGKKYKIPASTINSIVVRFPQKAKTLKMEPAKIISVSSGSNKDIMREISTNALKVVDLTLKSMVVILEGQERAKLSVSQLTSFMTAAAPYVMSKPDSKKPIDDPKQNLFRLFKENLKSRADAN